MFATALASDGPFSLRFPRGAAPSASTEPLEPIQVPSMVIEHRGRDLALFAVGKMVGVAMQAREKLLALGVSTTVVDARFVKPLAPELSSCGTHRAVITIEDGVASGGFGTAVTECSLQTDRGADRADGAARSVHRTWAQAALLGQLGLDAEGITAAALALLPATEVLAG